MMKVLKIVFRNIIKAALIVIGGYLLITMVLDPLSSRFCKRNVSGRMISSSDQKNKPQAERKTMIQVSGNDEVKNRFVEKP